MRLTRTSFSWDAYYRLTTRLGSCLLIDGEGQYGDSVGYPMSFSDYRYRGEQIEIARWDDVQQIGYVRLNLAAAYPDHLGVAHYTREFNIGPGRKFVCRDHVVLDESCTLSWLFQARGKPGIAPRGDGSFGLRHNTNITLRPSVTTGRIDGTVQESDVLFPPKSLENGIFEDSEHLRFDTAQPTDHITAEFQFSW